MSLALARAASALERRLFGFVTKGDDGECWEWRGARDKKGYGRMTMVGDPGGKAAKILVHRLSYFMRHLRLEDSACCLHRCDNPSCVNPSHLFLGTRRDNHRDMCEKGRNHKAKRLSHCKRGHPLVGANVYWHPRRNSRSCRACRNACALAFKRKNQRRKSK